MMSLCLHMCPELKLPEAHPVYIHTVYCVLLRGTGTSSTGKMTQYYLSIIKIFFYVIDIVIGESPLTTQNMTMVSFENWK